MIINLFIRNNMQRDYNHYGFDNFPRIIFYDFDPLFIPHFDIVYLNPLPELNLGYFRECYRLLQKQRRLSTAPNQKREFHCKKLTQKHRRDKGRY